MNIRTKIIGSYIVFVALILSFLVLNYALERSVMRRAALIYDWSEDVRLEMETENTFWRQVIALSDFFLAGHEEFRMEFHALERTFLKQLETIESTATSEAELADLREVKRRYAAFVVEFDLAADLFRTGKQEEAVKVETEKVDPAEHAVEEALETILKRKRALIDQAIADVRSDKKYALILPSLSATINNTEVIYTENQTLQGSLESESDFLKQVIAVTDLFLTDEQEEIVTFREYGTLFTEQLEYQKQRTEKGEERIALDLVEAKHLVFTNAFNQSVKLFTSGSKAQALIDEEKHVDPAEKEVAAALRHYYPFKQQNMKRSLDNVTLIDAMALSITRNLGLYIFLALIFGLGIATTGAIRITKPLTELAKATRGIAAGNFSSRLTVKNRDEVGRLAQSFNDMAQALQKTVVSKDYFDGIIKSMGDSLIVASADERIVTVNDATCRMLGYSETEVIGQPLSRLFKFDANKLEGEGPRDGVISFETNYLAKDGRAIPVVVSRNSMMLGDVQGIVCVAKDITELRLAAEKIRQSEHKLSLHIQQTPLAVIEWNLNAEIVEWNPAAKTIFGYRKDEVLGRQIVGLLVPESERELAEMEWNDLLSRKVGRHLTYHNLTKDGRTIICEWYNTPLDSEGRVIGVASMVQDFTERTEMEEELKRMRDAALDSARLKSEFLANMSHEIRTPMNGVIGMTGLLLDTELTDEQKDFAETIRSSGDALLTIINDILDFSKIEAGKLKFEMLDFDLSNAVESTIEMLAERAHVRRIELASLIHSDLPTSVRGDPGRLRQVLTNLIGNAIKFTEHGEVILRVKNESETDDHLIARFEVIDTGIGISEAAQKNLFEAFVQADGSTTRKYGGTGLGLAISKQLVELMGGTIGVSSVAGKGSTFWFTARFEKQSAGAVVAGEKPANLAGLHALIVDDNETNRKILTHQLSACGMTHEQADSGIRALELLRAAPARGQTYHLVILDLMMPGMDGFELAREITSDLTIAAVPLVLLTSFGQRGDSTTAREAGVAAYLTKPVRQSQLFECLANVINQPPATVTAVGKEADLVTRHRLVEKKPMSNKLILIAEDNVVNQKVAMRQIQKFGYRADAVANGLEALEALDRIRYDLVLMDCQMPQMDGYEATAEIRRREGRTRHTPIIAMTAHALDGDRAKCIAAGMDDYLSKPVSPEELGRLLERFFSQATEKFDPSNSESPVSDPPVDLVRLHLAIGDDPEEVREILDIYFESMATSLDDLNAAIDAGDANAVEHIGHNGAGTSANCGMTAVVDSFYALEAMGRKNHLAGAGDLARKVGHEYERIKIFLEENFQQVAV